MASFSKSIDRVLTWEGGYQKNPNDKGNYTSSGRLIGTNHGIAAPVLEDWLGYEPTRSQMRNLSLTTAKNIYKQRFWDKIQGDKIQNQAVADIIFDGAVNHGVALMTKFVQRELNIPDDGIFGSQTLKAVNNADPVNLYSQLKQRRINFYHYLANKPGQDVFLTGWLNRIHSFDDFGDFNNNSNGLVLMASLFLLILVKPFDV